MVLVDLTLSVLQSSIRVCPLRTVASTTLRRDWYWIITAGQAIYRCDKGFLFGLTVATAESTQAE